MLRYAITDRTLYADDEAERCAGILEQARRLSAEGIEYIQLREKTLPAQELIGLARQILNSIQSSRSSTRLLINSRADTALAAGAAGVHLPSGGGQLAPTDVRRLFAAAGSLRPLVSVSCHTLEEVETARHQEVDLILFGPVFGKSENGKIVVAATGLERLRDACKHAGDTPVLALGGVTAHNAARAIEAGAKGIAAIRLFR